MFRSVIAALALGLFLTVPFGRAGVQSALSTSTSLSPKCLAPGSKLFSLAPLNRTKAALGQGRTIRVFAFGSSSTAGVGASSVLASYPVRLEIELEKLLYGIDFAVTNLGLSGEQASGTAERIRAVIGEDTPDLLIWQVGTNDALAHVDPGHFAQTLQVTLQWLRSKRIDVVLVDPQYTPTLSRNEPYSRIVATIERIARQNRVPLVRRFEAMHHLSEQSADGARLYLANDQFHLNDLGYRCMAEHAARAITMSLVESSSSEGSVISRN